MSEYANISSASPSTEKATGTSLSIYQFIFRRFIAPLGYYYYVSASTLSKTFVRCLEDFTKIKSVLLNFCVFR